MSKTRKTRTVVVSILALPTLIVSFAWANGGPFVLKYPNGDPAAKGVLARLDPDLKPARENRLRVVKEDLKVTFTNEQFPAKRNADGPPLAKVSAEYTIENPTNTEIEVDFGFPILRGIYINPLSMMPRPDVQVNLDKKRIKSTIISNSAIYGIIRQRARQVIEDAITHDGRLSNLVRSVRSNSTEARGAARKALRDYLVGTLNWNEQDAVLMVEYASLDFGALKSAPPDRVAWMWSGDKELNELMNANLGPLTAIGEQKATQFFAQLACRFDPKAGAGYEAIFTAWGGDVRERSIDLQTGKLRPREITVDRNALKRPTHYAFGSNPMDPTIYARVDYLDSDAKINESEKASCKAILKNLPVIFTFAPMNILYYQVTFPAKSTQTLTVTYSQYPYSDTRSPSSYQLAYVVHPASLWKDFGPINLEVAVPEGISFRASVPCSNGGTEERPVHTHGDNKARFDIYRAELKQKTGELYLAIDADAWKRLGSISLVKRLSYTLRQLAQRAN
jgi:hypothetical protein